MLRPNKLVMFAPILALMCGITMSQAQSPVGVSVDQTSTGQAVSSDFAGLSYETLLLFPDSSGNYLFSHTNTSLINMFKTLGIKSLRCCAVAAGHCRYRLSGAHAKSIGS